MRLSARRSVQPAKGGSIDSEASSEGPPVSASSFSLNEFDSTAQLGDSDSGRRLGDEEERAPSGFDVGPFRTQFPRWSHPKPITLHNSMFPIPDGEDKVGILLSTVCQRVRRRSGRW